MACGHDAERPRVAPSPVDAAAAPLPVEAGPSRARRIVGYVSATSIEERQFHIADIPADRLTHVIYGFASVTADGQCVLDEASAMAELRALKTAHPALKTLLAIGGWSGSANFSVAAETPAKLAASCVARMNEHGFDGLDLDWEFPVRGGREPGRPQDRENFTALVAELRRQVGTRLFTIAAPATPMTMPNLEIEKVVANVDWVNLMTYDFHGAWDAQTGHNAALFNPPGDDLSVDAAVKTYRAAGTPADKIVVGLAAYGRGFARVTKNGIGQPFDGAPKGTWEDGVFDFRDLQANYAPKMTRTWDPVALVPSLYDGSTFISYEDLESAGLKGKYIREHDLGGAMLWELSGDDPKASLLDAVQLNW